MEGVIEMGERDLFLHEELMLLALKDRKGTVLGGTMYSYAIGGAVLAELLMRDRIRLTTEGKKDTVEGADYEPLGDPLRDEWLQVISERKKPRTLRDWVQRIAQTRKLKHRVASQLSRKGILRTEEDKLLGIFSRKVYPELDPEPEREINDRIEGAILDHGGSVEPRTAVLIALAHRAGLLKAVLDKDRLKKHKDRIEDIARGEATVEATQAAIEAMQAAMIAVTTVTSVATITTSS